MTRRRSLGRFEAFRSGLADVDCLGLEVERFHLDREVVDAELFVQSVANYLKQLRVRHRLVVADVRRQCVDAGRDRPDMKVMDTCDTGGLDDECFD